MWILDKLFRNNICSQLKRQLSIKSFLIRQHIFKHAADLGDDDEFNLDYAFFTVADSTNYYMLFLCGLVFQNFMISFFSVQLLNRKDKTTFEKLDYLLSKEDNYKRTREYIRSLKMVPTIPYLGECEQLPYLSVTRFG